jgi:ferric-dicitrate binding protein FerR (iron transport regulator)
VAAEFNRYGSIPVEIDDAELRLLPVSGTIDASDTESFVAFLKSLPSVSVERTPKRIRVVKVAPATIA